jgi:murein DD-endopeptidase MepM/ murein hydrolase activator NlpD
MKIGVPSSSFLLAGLLVAIGGAGCSTARPLPSERQGLLDRISRADHSRQSKRFASLSKAPASQTAAGRAPASLNALAKNGDSHRAAMEVAVGQMHWPLQQVQITSSYGQRGREFHEGIDLRAKTGTTVFAAQEGTVIYAGAKIRGYGRMVVIRHYREISTIYAHNSRLLVRIGQYVRQGQKIAISGNTGHSHGPHLHFEVRDGMAALNPLEILPTTKTAQAAGVTDATAVESRRVAETAPLIIPRRGSRRSAAHVARSEMVASAKEGSGSASGRESSSVTR